MYSNSIKIEQLEIIIYQANWLYFDINNLTIF